MLTVRSFLLATTCFCSIFHSYAQQKKNYDYVPPSQTNLDLNLAVGQGASLGAAYTRLKSVSKDNRLKIGFGARLTTFYASNRDFLTAPAKLTTGKQGPAVFFADIIPENIDTIQVSNASVCYINLKVGLQYTFRRIDLGADIDLIGGTFGVKREATFRNQNLRAKPTNFNILLIGDNDRGSLNSEVYLRYWLNYRLAIRTGISYQFIEYKTASPIASNDRFRTKVAMPFIAITYSPFEWVWKDLK